MRLPRRITAIQPPVIPILGDLIRSTPGTISLGQGIVSYGPPPECMAALSGFGTDLADHRYGPVEGEADLRGVIANKLATENRMPLDGRRIVVTAGGNMGFLNAVLAVTDPGDEVILPIPFYFNHDMALTMIGCRAVPVPTDARHQLDVQAIERAITPRTRAIVTISPNNPSSAVYPEEALRAVNALCARHGLIHIADEVYEYFTYGDVRHYSPGSDPDSVPHTVSLFSLSKAYGLASWRMGYMVIPEALFDAVNKIQDTNLICPPVVSQYAALGALEAGEPFRREKIDGIASTRELVIDELSEIADLCTVGPADGALYFLLRVHSELPPMTLVERLVTEHAVAAIPGSTFGLEGCYLRISFGALERETVAEGIGRFVEGLRAIV
jgi:aspartate/methionine/tyrosine aminotransferase